MKLLILVSAVLAFVLSITGQRELTEVDLTVNGIHSGSAVQSLRRLGKPQRIRRLGLNECANQYERTFFFSGLKIGVLGSKDGKRGEVYSLEVTSPRWVISPGLKIGAGKTRLVKEFGKPVSDDGSSFTYVTKDNLGIVSFEFRNGRLTKAEMTETLC